MELSRKDYGRQPIASRQYKPNRIMDAKDHILRHCHEEDLDTAINEFCISQSYLDCKMLLKLAVRELRITEHRLELCHKALERKHDAPK